MHAKEGRDPAEMIVREGEDELVLVEEARADEGEEAGEPVGRADAAERREDGLNKQLQTTREQAGKTTEQEVYREFLETFDVGGELDGRVTLDEFKKYYANVSSSVDDDDYFELMIRMARRLLTRSSTRVEKRSIGAASRRLSRNQRNRS